MAGSRSTAGLSGSRQISPSLVAELIGLLNERDRIMCASADRTYALPKEMYLRIMQIQEMLHREVGRNDPCPCQSGLKYKKCCGREY